LLLELLEPHSCSPLHSQDLEYWRCITPWIHRLSAVEDGSVRKKIWAHRYQRWRLATAAADGIQFEDDEPGFNVEDDEWG
ncbi:hypothetical protein LINPERHAP1_LOCUS24800, partial [Linum perenne]